MTGVLIHVADWSHALSVWLDARHALVREWGVAKHAELHAVDLVKGRGRYCETREQEDAFLAARQAAYGLLLGRVHRTRAQVLTVGAKASGPTVYGLLVDQLERWAADRDTHIVVIYDGQEAPDTIGLSTTAAVDARRRAGRNASPYRRVHRELELGRRRVVEDVIVQDSRYSQFIQMTDLVAYGAFHTLVEERPELWRPRTQASRQVVKAYRKTEPAWLVPESSGIIWVDL